MIIKESECAAFNVNIDKKIKLLGLTEGFVVTSEVESVLSRCMRRMAGGCEEAECASAN